MDPKEAFRQEVDANIEALRRDGDVQALSRIWVREISRYKYPYNFTWMGRPLIQLPQDVFAMQELIWQVQPDVIVETGIAHGGSLVFYASMLELLGGDRFVLGVDIDIRPHNRAAIEAHPMWKRIKMIEGSAVEEGVLQKVREHCAGRKRVLVVLDSNHTHEHVLRELELYAPLVKEGSYLVVMDTLVEDLPAEFSAGKPWGPGNNPKTAVRAFLARNDRFVVDSRIDAKLLISVAPEGYLRCVKG